MGNDKKVVDFRKSKQSSLADRVIKDSLSAAAMNDEHLLTQISALWGSLDHWRRNVEIAETDDFFLISISDGDCPCCRLWLYDNDCRGCPVYEKTSKKLCDGTPYWPIADAIDCLRYPVGIPGKEETKEGVATAIREWCLQEYEFLADLTMELVEKYQTANESE